METLYRLSYWGERGRHYTVSRRSPKSVSGALAGPRTDPRPAPAATPLIRPLISTYAISADDRETLRTLPSRLAPAAAPQSHIRTTNSLLRGVGGARP